jgi:dTDP-4-amino-4,6-dideoxy-D-glucose ammonia-lyase
MRLGYTYEKNPHVNSKYWTNTILPLLQSGHLEAAVDNKYVYPHRIGLYPGLSCQFFCSFCGRNYNAEYSKSIAMQSFDVFKKVIDLDPRDHNNWQDRFRISGGLEPLTNPMIGNIISYGKTNNFNMQMYSNGYAMSPRFLEQQPGLFDLEVLRISMYGVDENSYAKVTKNSKGYKIVKENIRNFLKQNTRVKVGINWIILPGHSDDLILLFDLIEDINSTQEQKIQFITLREDFSQSSSYISNEERKKLHDIFLKCEERCAGSPDLRQLHIDYGYQLDPVRQGQPAGPLKMANWNQLNHYGFPQISTTVDSLGNLYVYHESGFIERAGSDRYIIGNIINNNIEEIIKKHLSSKGIKPKPFDVTFLDAFDHLITLVLDDAKNNVNGWKDHIKTKWQ